MEHLNHERIVREWIEKADRRARLADRLMTGGFIGLLAAYGGVALGVTVILR